MRAHPAFLLSALLLVLASSACPARERQRDAGAPAPTDLLPYQTLAPGEGVLYSFFNHRAEMQTTEDPAEVPASVRAAVKLTDPRHPLGGDYILVADLRTQPAAVQLQTNSAWLDQMMPKTSQLAAATGNLPAAQAEKVGRPRQDRSPSSGPDKPKPGKLTRLAKEPAVRPSSAEASPVQLRAPSLEGLPSVQELARSGQQPIIILFSTSWCPSCRAARSYLQQRGLPFRDLDVEQDPTALQEYQAVQAAARLRPGVVPVIVVNGRAFQGFSKTQLEAALAGS